MNRYKTEMNNKYSALQQELWSLRNTLNQTKNSLQSVHGSMGNSLKDARSEVKVLDERLKVLESKPQEMLIKQVDTINKDVRIDYCIPMYSNCLPVRNAIQLSGNTNWN